MQLLAIQVYTHNKCTVPAGERSRRRSPTAAAVKLIAAPETLRPTPTGTKSSLKEPGRGWHSQPVTLWAHEGVLSGHNACVKCESKITLVENTLPSFLFSQFTRQKNCTTRRTSAVKELFLLLFAKKKKICPQDYGEVNRLSCRQQLVKQQEITYGTSVTLQKSLRWFKYTFFSQYAQLKSIFPNFPKDIGLYETFSCLCQSQTFSQPKLPSFPFCPNPVNVRVVSPRAWRSE